MSGTRDSRACRRQSTRGTFGWGRERESKVGEEVKLLSGMLLFEWLFIRERSFVAPRDDGLLSFEPPFIEEEEAEVNL